MNLISLLTPTTAKTTEREITRHFSTAFVAFFPFLDFIHRSIWCEKLTNQCEELQRKPAYASDYVTQMIVAHFLSCPVHCGEKALIVQYCSFATLTCV